MTQTVFQTPTAQAVVDFAPTKQYPSFSGPINYLASLDTEATAGNVTYTYGNILSGIILRDTGSSARTDTFPTAALLVPQIEGAQVGSTIRLLIRNTSAGAGTLTIAAGTGGTLSGTTATSQIPYLQQEEYLIRVTAVGASPTYTVYGLGLTTF